MFEKLLLHEIKPCAVRASNTDKKVIFFNNNFTLLHLKGTGSLTESSNMDPCKPSIDLHQQDRE